MTEPEHVRRNRAHWTRENARYTGASAQAAWSRQEIQWGKWGAAESRVRALPEMAGRDVIELGCGTAYLAAGIKRLGARRVVGVDITPAQLETARALNAASGLGLELIEANAEAVPLADASFDVAVSEYGASIWCDPELWIPEAARLLREGGELVFLRGSTLSVLCMPDEGVASECLQRSQRDLGRLDWEDPGDPSTEFHLPTGELLRVLRGAGFELTDLVELYAPDDATDHRYYSYVPAEWAKRWPDEEIWRAVKTG